MKWKKIDLKKVDLKKTATWNVWKIGFGIDINKVKKKIDVTKHYIPKEEQQKLIDYMLKNYRKLTTYKGYCMPKSYISKKLAWERFCYFPSEVKSECKKWKKKK